MLRSDKDALSRKPFLRYTTISPKAIDWIPILPSFQLGHSLKLFFLADGSFRTLQPNIDLVVLKALFTPRGKERVKDADWETNP